jgi:hypothetical protein
MELGEAIGLDFVDVKELAPNCENNKKKKEGDWKARVNGLGTDTKKCSGGNLYDESPHGLKHRREEHFKDKNLGYVPEKKGNDHWLSGGLDAVDPENFPLQAHHLIPKNFLPKHHVCLWLCKNFDKDDTYKLKEDTYYNTDHANNGYAMPYATPLKEWKKAKNDDAKCHVAYRVMEKTGIQLHQGSHAEFMDIGKVKAKIPASLRHLPSAASAGSDDMEEDSIHAAGYLNTLKKWLDGVASQINEHVEKCGVCKGEQDSKGKIEVQPLEDSVKLMNQVSYITKVFLKMNLMFTCPYGAAYASQKDFITWDSTTNCYRPVGEKSGAST